MNNAHQIVNVALFTACLLLLARLYFVEYREYRVARTRFKLFALRDELFELGAKREVAFNAPAYGMLRVMLNGAIRFAHRYNLISATFMMASLEQNPAFKQARQHQRERWNLAKSQLAPDVQEKLEALRRRYVHVMIEQMVYSSLLSCLALTPLALCVMVISASHAACSKVYGWIERPLSPNLDVLATAEGELSWRTAHA